MADLKLTRRDGWAELDGIDLAIRSRSLAMGDLWSAIANGDREGAAAILDQAGLLEPGRDNPTQIKLIVEPDGILGERYRVWVKI